MKLDIEVKGLAELAAKLDGKVLYWEPIKSALNDLGKQAAGDASRQAPRLSGALSSGITHKVNARPMPLWVVVKTNVVHKSGSRYPWILEFDGKYGHKNWLKNAIRRAQGDAARVLQAAVKQIESNWNS